MPFHLFCQQFGIPRGVPNQKRRAKAGGKRWLRFGYACFCAGDFSGIAAHVVVHRLFRSQFTYRWKNAKRVANQENNVARMRSNARHLDVFDEFHRIRRTRVFGNGTVSIINNSRIRVVDNVLENRAESNRVINFRLAFFGKVDALGIAAAFNVEYAKIRPAMFVVADKASVCFR